MQFQIYNTLNRRKEVFEPTSPGKAGVYSCGPTVYSTPHIGNLRAAFFADILRCTLQNILGYELTHVMNITDVGHLVSDDDDGEDKMQKGAQREGLTAWEVAKKYEQIFMDSLAALNIEPFSVMPRATEHIQEQIDLVKALEENGYIYIIEDGVYMDTSKIEDYGKLMGANYKKHLEGIKSGARIDDSGKKNPTDFALWKFSPEGEVRDMERDSPWGKGFPGRHIECSAMSSKYLGQQFDIHTGGVEHIPIHHTDEIAQSECAFGHKPWVKYWMHNQHLQVDGGKMSKSLGTVYNLENLEEKGFSGVDLRYFFLTAHYRNFQNFSWELIESAQKARLNLNKKLSGQEFEKYEKLEDLERVLGDDEKVFLNNLLDAVTDDLNTATAIAEINKASKDLTKGICQIIYFLDQNLLKLNLFEKIEEEKADIPEEVIELANRRLEAKKNKDYQTADALRDHISELGFVVKDEKDGFQLEIK